MAYRRRRIWPGLLIGLVVLVGLLWVGYWYAARTIAESAISRVNAGPINGQKINCTEATVGGFPLRLDVRCARSTFASVNDALTAALGGVAASAPLYLPGTIQAKLDAPLVINAPLVHVALTTSWSAGSATASAWTSGLTGIGAAFEHLKVETSDTPLGSPFTAASADTAAGEIRPAGGESYNLNASATRLSLTRADGTSFPTIDGEARLTAVDVGSSLGNDPLRTLLVWVRKGGTVNIETVRVAAVGAIVSLAGSLSLSPEGLLSGSLLIRYNDINAVGALIEAIRPGWLEQDTHQFALVGLHAATIPATSPDGPVRQTSITFVDGTMFLGFLPLPVDPIPPIRF